jgi:hypothetical protein
LNNAHSSPSQQFLVLDSAAVHRRSIWQADSDAFDSSLPWDFFDNDADVAFKGPKNGNLNLVLIVHENRR